MARIATVHCSRHVEQKPYLDSKGHDAGQEVGGKGAAGEPGRAAGHHKIQVRQQPAQQRAWGACNAGDIERIIFDTSCAEEKGRMGTRGRKIQVRQQPLQQRPWRTCNQSEAVSVRWMHC